MTLAASIAIVFATAAVFGAAAGALISALSETPLGRDIISGGGAMVRGGRG